MARMDMGFVRGAAAAASMRPFFFFFFYLFGLRGLAIMVQEFFAFAHYFKCRVMYYGRSELRGQRHFETFSFPPFPIPATSKICPSYPFELRSSHHFHRQPFPQNQHTKAIRSK